MKKQMFEELLASVREAGAILRGRKKPSRRIVIGATGVGSIRERTRSLEPLHVPKSACGNLRK